MYTEVVAAAALVIVETVDPTALAALVPVLVRQVMQTPLVAVALVPITAQVAGDLTVLEGRVQALLER